MKRCCSILALAAFLAVFALPLRAEESATYEEPVLITSCGQSADVVIAKVMAKKAGLDFKFRKAAQIKHLKDIKTLIIVAGGSSKGLGAAGIDVDDEIKRIKELQQEAVKKSIKIILMHVGGKGRRGPMSDKLIKASAEKASAIIVVKGGNHDNLFSKMAEKKDIELTQIEKSRKLKALFKKLFNKTEESEQ